MKPWSRTQTHQSHRQEIIKYPISNLIPEHLANAAVAHQVDKKKCCWGTGVILSGKTLDMSSKILPLLLKASENPLKKTIMHCS